MATAPSDELAYPDRAQGMVFLTLAATPAAVGSSRQLVRLTLSRWGLSELAADAELVVSELATNAVQATGTSRPETALEERGTLATIQVRVLMYQGSIVLEVWDSDPSTPARHDAASDEEGGRGLMIVTALCREWDYFHAARGGKVVWAELAVPADLLTPARLPRRIPGSANAPRTGPARSATRGCCPGFIEAWKTSEPSPRLCERPAESAQRLPSRVTR